MAPHIPIWLYGVVAAVGAVAAYLLTPGVRVYAMKIGALKIPRDRDVHRVPTPTLGGIALYAAFLVALGVAAAIPELRPTFRFTQVFGLAAGGLATLVVGIVDDLRDLPWHVKLAADVFAAGILFQSGVQMSFFWLPPPIGVVSLSLELSALVTIFWIILLIQAVNFVDGLDGLAAGLTMIAAGAFFLYARQLEGSFPLGPPLTQVVAAAIIGVCLGFLRHNFNPAKIMMGDSGARLLGFLVAATTISMMGAPVARESQGGRLALPLVFAPILFLAIPITDTVFAFVRRTARGQAFFHADIDHIHHRLLRLGHSQRQAVLVMYGWALLLGGGLVVAGMLPWGRFMLLFAVAVGTIALFTVAPRLRGDNGLAILDEPAPQAKPASKPNAQRV